MILTVLCTKISLRQILLLYHCSDFFHLKADKDANKQSSDGPFPVLITHFSDGQAESSAAWSCWTEWTACSVTCGSQGTRQRTRTCVPGTDSQDVTCAGDHMESESCGHPDGCPGNHCPPGFWHSDGTACMYFSDAEVTAAEAALECATAANGARLLSTVSSDGLLNMGNVQRNLVASLYLKQNLI